MAQVPSKPSSVVASPAQPSLAYRNEAFLDSADARPIRILAEYLEPLRHFRAQGVHDTVVFFGSARLTEEGPLGRYYREARELARRLSEWSATLPGARKRFVVCSGGGPGIMEAANRGATDAGATTIGLNIGLPYEQRPNPYVTKELGFEFRYFFMRKFWFAYLARALVVFPGGFGTLDELTEFLTLSQTRKLSRSLPILLYGRQFWTKVINFEELERQGMISSADLALFRIADGPEEAFDMLREVLSPHVSNETAAQSPAVACSCDAHTVVSGAHPPPCCAIYDDQPEDGTCTPAA